MTRWTRWLGRGPRLDSAQQSALDAYRKLPRLNADATLDTLRLVVVDVETSGLNVYSDRLIVIGAVIIDAGALPLAQGFEAVLRQTAPSTTDNILIHGVGGTAQTTGVAPAEALLAFLRFAGNAPLIAFHAHFDRTMIERASDTFLGMTMANPWLDVALLAPGLYPDLAQHCKTLDDWTNAFGIINDNRHNAVADACATAQLLLVLVARARGRGLHLLRDLMQLEKDQRWLARGA